MTNYLNICPKDLIHRIGEQFNGMIKPQNYPSFLDYDPFTILLEGIHQFCVKITIINHPPIDTHLGARVPSQIKRLTLFQQPNFEDHNISGHYIQLNTFFLITFNVSTKQNLSVAEGEIYVATSSHF